MTFEPEMLEVNQRLRRIGLEPSFQWKLQRNTLA